MPEPRLIPVSDHAVLVEFDSTISDSAMEAVQMFDQAIAQMPPEGMLETIPAFVNLLIVFDPLLTDHDTIMDAVRPMLDQSTGLNQTAALHTVHVCYDLDFAPDLMAVVKQTGLDSEAVIDAHVNADYKVGMYGFAPGYAYLSGTPDTIQVPRKPSPARGIPIGSVMIAGPQCLVTTLDMPTGWSIIGCSPTTILSDDSDRPFLFDVGDRVRFERIDREQFDVLKHHGSHD